MKKNNTSFILIFIVLAIFAAVYLVNQKAIFSPKANVDNQNQSTEQNIPVINTSQDLDNQLEDLDKINFDQIDQNINENTVDLNQL